MKKLFFPLLSLFPACAIPAVAMAGVVVPQVPVPLVQHIPPTPIPTLPQTTQELQSTPSAVPAPALPGATPSQGATPPEVSKRETMGVLNGMNQVPLSPEEINVMRHRVEKEGLTPEIQKGIENLSARGQQDVKDGKLTPEQIQKNAHAMNQLGDTVNRQPDSPQKDSVLEHIRKLVGMLVEALKRIFSRGRASAGPGMGI